MSENGPEESESAGGGQREGYMLLRVAGWVVFGILLGGALVAVFFAYGQPEILLEQMNLRYCG